LASCSPRRRALLREAGLDFALAQPALNEPRLDETHLSPKAHVEALAYFKARSVAESFPDSAVLGADTIVVLGGCILGKAHDAAGARRMLSALSGSRHAVITGVAVLGPRGRRRIASETTWVTMRPMSEAEIDAYIDSGEWKDKAGGYAIQESGDRFIEKVDGSFTNVVGLPMELLGRMLQGLGARSENG